MKTEAGAKGTKAHLPKWLCVNSRLDSMVDVGSLLVRML